MDPTFTAETERLRRSWDQHPQEMLRDYMVAGIHDPRVNPQSIRGRHFLIEALFGQKFRKLCEEEFRFAAVLQWLTKTVKHLTTREDWEAVDYALTHGADDAEGTSLPHFISNAFKLLPMTTDGVVIPNYLTDALRAIRQHDGPARAFAEATDLFATLWNQRLTLEPPANISVIEPACGSANDYRALRQCGLSRFLDYQGFDLCGKNVANARELFPEARFETGNVFSIDAADRSFDCCFAHDLLEHLSLEGMERAVSEICRVTRRGIFVGFFQMHEGGEHIVRPVDEYHWNTLSLPLVRELFEQRGFSTQAICVDSWWRHWLGSAEPLYYDTAYDLVAWRNPESKERESTV